MSARTPTATAMHAVTLDHLSNGRLILGLGVSGPQVVEGWYGQPFAKPLARTREYVEIIRRALRREGHLSFEGEHYSHPYHGPGSLGLGKPLKIDDAPVARRRPDLPRRRGSEERRDDGRDRRRLAAAVLLAVPPRGVRRPARGRQGRLRGRGAVQHQRDRRRGSRAHAVEGVARLLHRRHGRRGCQLPHQSDGAHGLRGARPTRSSACSSRASATKRSRRCRRRSPTRSRSSARRERIRDRLQAWEDSPVTTLLVGVRDADTMRTLAELVL